MDPNKETITRGQNARSNTQFDRYLGFGGTVGKRFHINGPVRLCKDVEMLPHDGNIGSPIHNQLPTIGGLLGMGLDG